MLGVCNAEPRRLRRPDTCWLMALMLHMMRDLPYPMLGNLLLCYAGTRLSSLRPACCTAHHAKAVHVTMDANCYSCQRALGSILRAHAVQQQHRHMRLLKSVIRLAPQLLLFWTAAIGTDANACHPMRTKPCVST